MVHAFGASELTRHEPRGHFLRKPFGPSGRPFAPYGRTFGPYGRTFEPNGRPFGPYERTFHPKGGPFGHALTRRKAELSRSRARGRDERIGRAGRRRRRSAPMTESHGSRPTRATRGDFCLYDLKSPS